MTLALLCAAALIGLAMGDLVGLEPAGLACTAALGLAAAALARQHTGWRLAALFAAATSLGALRAALAPPPASAYAALGSYLGSRVRVHGTITSAPTPSSSGAALLFQLDAHAVGAAGRDPPPIQPDGAPVRLRAVADPAALAAAGDAVVLEGRLVPPEAGRGPPTLLFPTLLAHAPPDAHGAPFSTALGELRARAEAGLHRYLPEPEGSLAIGVLLGGSAGLDPVFRQNLQRSGLAHLVAIDGFKMVAVTAALGTVAVPLLGQRLATLLVLAAVGGYTLLTGAHPSAVRAALMVGLASSAALTGRVADPLTSLLLAVLVMATIEPRILLDVGLQLSLSAVLGLVLLWPRLRRHLNARLGITYEPQPASWTWRRALHLLLEPAGLTLAVTLATLPVMLSVFQIVSLVSPLAHIFAVPLLVPVLGSAALLALVSPFAPLATVASWLAWLPTRLLAAQIDYFGSLPGAAVATGRLPPSATLALAAALLAWGVWGVPELRDLRIACARRTPRSPGWLPYLSGCAALCGAVTLLLARPDGQLHVCPLYAGRGSAVLVRGPTGRTVLLVGGRFDGSQLANQLADHLAVWEHKLDLVLELDTAASARVATTLARYPADLRISADHDERLDLGGGAVLDIYAPTPDAPLAVSLSTTDTWQPLVGQPSAPDQTLRSAQTISAARPGSICSP